MKIRSILSVMIVVLLGMSGAKAQDIHFSQFYASPLNLNPAITGVMTCDMRVSAIYRNQWASVLGGRAFNTFSAGVEGKFPVGNKGDHYGLGLNLWADKAGSSRLSSVQGSLSASYLKKIGGRKSNNHYLVAGAQLGVSQRSLKVLELQFGSQWDGDSFNGNLATQEDLANNRLTYADLNAGILWFSSLDKDNKSNFYVGASFNHLTKANLSHHLLGGDILFTKFSVHAGGEFRLGQRSRMALVPAVSTWFQGPSFELNAGTAFKFDFSKKSKSNQAFQIGAFARMVGAEGGIGSDAIVALFRLRFGSSHFGISYDINISPLSGATRGNGAFEVSYVYTLCGARRGRPMGCPTF